MLSGSSSFGASGALLGVGVASWLDDDANTPPNGVAGTPFVAAPGVPAAALAALFGVVEPSKDDDAMSSSREVAASSLRIKRVSAWSPGCSEVLWAEVCRIDEARLLPPGDTCVLSVLAGDVAIGGAGSVIFKRCDATEMLLLSVVTAWA